MRAAPHLWRFQSTLLGRLVPAGFAEHWIRRQALRPSATLA